MNLIARLLIKNHKKGCNFLHPFRGVSAAFTTAWDYLFTRLFVRAILNQLIYHRWICER